MTYWDPTPIYCCFKMTSVGLINRPPGTTFNALYAKAPKKQKGVERERDRKERRALQYTKARKAEPDYELPHLRQPSSEDQNQGLPRAR